MSEIGKAQAQGAAPAPAPPQLTARPPERAQEGLGNLAIVQMLRVGAAAAFPGAPLGNQQQQGSAPVRCDSCEPKARRFGVQAKCSSCQTRAKSDSVDVVRPALQSASQPLPHYDLIQAAFGRHDLSHVRTLTGGAARSASENIGARAFTSEGRIAFREAPDAWLAAHESAHVIQQRDGKSAPHDGDDAWERHADRVADAVVAGRSAQPLLGQIAGGDGRSAPGLQRDDDKKDKKAEDKTADERSADDKSTDDNKPGASMLFEGLELTDSRKKVREILEEYAAGQDHPHRELKAFVERIRPKAEESDPQKRIAHVVIDVAADIVEENNAWIEDFHRRAVEIANGILDDSRDRMVAELEHYGVRDLRVEGFFSPRVSGEMNDDKATRGMGMAAQGLLARKEKLEQAQFVLQKAQSTDRFLDGPVQGNLKEANDDYLEAKRDYDVFKMQSLAMFPVLAAYTDGEAINREGLSQMTNLQKGRDPETTAVIVDTLAQRLYNIQECRKGLQPGGDINIWRVPKIVAGTRAQVESSALRNKLVDERVEAEQPSALTAILIGLVQLALVLAAPETGGLSLIPAAVISVASAYDQFKDYELQQKLNTDFGPAALSVEEPSLFWLAAAIIGAGLDVLAAGGAAFKVFRYLAKTARAIKVGVSAEQAAHDLAALEKALVDLHNQTLLESVRDQAKAIQNTGSRVGMTAEEAEAIGPEARKALMLGEEAEEPFNIVKEWLEVPGPNGSTVRLSTLPIGDFMIDREIERALQTTKGQVHVIFGKHGLETGHWGSTETTSIIKMFEKYRDNPRVVIHALNKLDAAMGAPPELAAKWFARNVGMQAREGDLIIGASCNTAWNESLEEMWRFREPNPGGPISRPTGGGPTGAAPTGPGPMDAEPAYGGRAPAAPKAPVGFGPWEQRIGMGQLIHYNRHPNGRIVIVGHGAQYQGQMIRVPSHIRELRYYGKAGEPYLGYVTYEAFQEGVDVQTKAGYTLQVAKPGDLVPQHVLAPLSEWDKELLSDMGYTLEYGTQVEEGTITLDQLLTQMPEGASVDLSACRGDLKDVKWLGAGKK